MRKNLFYSARMEKLNHWMISAFHFRGVKWIHSQKRFNAEDTGDALIVKLLNHLPEDIHSS